MDPAQHTQSDKVVMGSLILQQYKTWWDYDLQTPSTKLKLQLSETCTLDFAYIGDQTLFATSSPFTALKGAIEQIYLNPDEFHYRVTVGGSLGFQGYTTFLPNILGQYI